MSFLFFLLFIAAVVFLIIGLVRPTMLKDLKGHSLSRKQASIGFGVLAFVFFVLVGVTAPPTTSTPEKEVTAKAATPTPSKSATPSPSSTAAAKAAGSTQALPKLSGVGALWADWVAAKGQSDSRYVNGCCFEPNSKFDVSGSDSQDDRYYSAFWSDKQNADSRITGYEERLVPHQTQAEAQAVVLEDFPGDTSVLWTQANTSNPADACYQMEVRSPTLAQVFGLKGDMFIEFSTEPAPDPATYNNYYDASNVNDALIQHVDYKSASDAVGC